MTGLSLVAWDTLDRRRRRGAGVARSAFLTSTIAGVVVGVGLWWIARGVDVSEARGWWGVLAMGAVAGVVMAGPWQVYWRPEAALLARLPIGGRAIYALALSRSMRAAVWLFLPLALGAVAIVIAPQTASPTPTGRMVEWMRLFTGWMVMTGAAALSLVGAGLAAPAVTTAAGALVASERAQAAVASMAGEFAGPRVIWLSLLPAAAGFTAAWIFYRGAAWIAPTAAGHGYAATAHTFGILIAGAALFAIGLPLAARWLPAATREVAALDRVQLAKVETTRAVGVEALWGRVAAGAAGGAMYRKDVALARRRYPAFYLVTGIGQVAAWLVSALADSPRRERIVIAIVFGLGAYAVVFARRLTRPPIEEARLLRTLPIPPAAAGQGKAAYAVWRAVVPLALASAVAIARAGSPLRLAAVITAIIAAAAIGAMIASRPR